MTAALAAAFVADATPELKRRLEVYRAWLESRVAPPDEDLVPLLVDAMDGLRIELERRALIVDMPKPEVEEVGALAQWRKELARGVGGQRADKSSTWRLDALHRAACLESAGREWDRLGIPSIGDSCRRDAAKVIAERPSGEVEAVTATPMVRGASIVPKVIKPARMAG